MTTYRIVLSNIQTPALADEIRDRLEQHLHRVAVVGLVEEVASPGDPIVVHTDGGYLHHLNVGAWAFFIESPDGETHADSAAVEMTTNNRMEMTAVLQALRQLKGVDAHQKVMILTDSEYVVNGLTMWARGWAKNGWKTKGGTDVKNRDLWEELLAEYYSNPNFKIKHVEGHAGIPGNEICDEMCQQAMAAKIQKGMEAGKKFQASANG